MHFINTTIMQLITLYLTYFISSDKELCRIKIHPPIKSIRFHNAFISNTTYTFGISIIVFLQTIKSLFSKSSQIQPI